MRQPLINRRSLLGALAGAGVLLSVRQLHGSAPARPARSPNVLIESFSADGTSTGTTQVPRVVKTDAQWRRQLSPLAYEVTRRHGTERPFSGEYDKHKGDGLYHCICCNTALFDSRTKYDSRTGWPSFWQPISKANVTETLDTSLGMRRTEIACTRCDAHLGHVFNDGPRPTGLRYCMNSVSLNFRERAAGASGDKT